MCAGSREGALGVSTQNGLIDKLPDGAYNTVIAHSPIVMVVNKTNPVDNLSHKELKAILSGRITNWKELGGDDLEIENVMLAPCVKNTVGEKIAAYGSSLRELKPRVKLNPMKDTNILVEANQGAIGQQIYGYHSEQVKVLRIDGLLPGEYGQREYGLYQDYNVVTYGSPTGPAKELLRVATTSEGRRVISSLNHLPVGFSHTDTF